MRKSKSALHGLFALMAGAFLPILPVLAQETGPVHTCRGDRCEAPEVELTGCALVVGEAQDWTADQPIDTADALLTQASEICDADTFQAVKFRVSNVILREVHPRWDVNVQSAEQRELANKLNFLANWNTDHWQVYAMLADLAFAEKRYQPATSLYNSAILRSDSEFSTEKKNVPPDSVYQYLIRTGQTSQMLADEYTAAPVDYAGQISGTMVMNNTRGTVVNRVLLPIQFITGVDTFTEKGMHAMDDLWRLFNKDLDGLKEEQSDGQVCLIGHSDPTGPAGVNQRLSEKRSAAVKADLKRRAVREGNTEILSVLDAISTKGCGEDAPIEFVHPTFSKLTGSEKNQIMRRVELDQSGTCGCQPAKY